VVNKPFHQQTLILSGGLGDIGRAMALEFGRQGAAVAIGDVRSPRTADAFLSKLKRQRVRCHYSQVDVSDAGAVSDWVKRVEKNLALPTIIIANAAIVTLVNLFKLTPRQWSRELQVNLDGAFHLVQAATALLVKRQRPGRVLFLGSWAGHRPHRYIPAYCVAKAGLRMLCQCFALELARHNILVNELAPGIVDAGVSRQVQKKNPGLRAQAMRKVPVGRLISAREVAEQAILLCNPKQRHVTGSTFLMDGGLSLLSG
jgi:glucose 1-dehydrogenase